MGKPFTKEDYDNVKGLIGSGLEGKEIAKRIGRSPAAVCYLLKEIKEGRDYIKHTGGRLDLKEREDVDLSKYPDHVLFRHSKEYIL